MAGRLYGGAAVCKIVFSGFDSHTGFLSDRCSLRLLLKLAKRFVSKTNYPKGYCGFESHVINHKRLFLSLNKLQ